MRPSTKRKMRGNIRASRQQQRRGCEGEGESEVGSMPAHRGRYGDEAAIEMTIAPTVASSR